MGTRACAASWTIASDPRIGLSRDGPPPQTRRLRGWIGNRWLTIGSATARSVWSAPACWRYGGRWAGAAVPTRHRQESGSQHPHSIRFARFRLSAPPSSRCVARLYRTVHRHRIHTSQPWANPAPVQRLAQIGGDPSSFPLDNASMPSQARFMRIVLLKHFAFRHIIG